LKNKPAKRKTNLSWEREREREKEEGGGEGRGIKGKKEFFLQRGLVAQFKPLGSITVES
jgi:hypothetical protein